MLLKLNYFDTRRRTQHNKKMKKKNQQFNQVERFMMIGSFHYRYSSVSRTADDSQAQCLRNFVTILI